MPYREGIWYQPVQQLKPQRATQGMRVIRSSSKCDELLIVGEDIDNQGDPITPDAGHRGKAAGG